MDRVLKNQDWIWFAKYDSQLISATRENPEHRDLPEGAGSI